MTYTEIAADVISWLNRTGFTNLEAEVPTFVEFAQRRIWRKANFNAMLTEVSFDTDTPTIPVDLLRVHTMTIPNGSRLVEVNGAPLKKVIQEGSSVGMPCFYAPVGLNFRFGPTPDTNYSVDLVYYASLPNISPSVATNWVSDNNPELILFGALLEACLWLKDDTRAAVWEGRFQETLTNIQNSENKLGYEDGALRVYATGARLSDSVRAN